MKLNPEDPRLTAYLLGELAADESAAVEHAVAADPALRQALQELQDVQRLLTGTLAPQPAALLPSQRETIRRAARQAPPFGKITPLNARRKFWHPWFVPLAVAAAIVLVAAIFAPLPQLGKGHATSRKAASPATPSAIPGTLPAPGPSQPQAPPPVATLPTTEPGVYPVRRAAAADFPSLELPVRSGTASLGWIRKSIRAERKLPPRGVVRLEEILNSFPLQPQGVTAVARIPAGSWHPDARNSGLTTHAATLAAETLACPWKPSASLVIVSLRGNPLRDCEVKAVFRANPSNVRSYRLLGFSPTGPHAQSPLPTRLPAKTNTILALEVDPSNPTGEIGVIDWSVNGQSAAPISIARNGASEPSDDARFAALICTYAQWLSGESSAVIDTELLAAIARENASETLPADRADFLTLIDQSLNL